MVYAMNNGLDSLFAIFDCPAIYTRRIPAYMEKIPAIFAIGVNTPIGFHFALLNCFRQQTAMVAADS
jgi:hypothetical protein